MSLGIVAGVLAMLLPPAAVAVGDATDPASSIEEAGFAPGSFSAHLAEVRPALAAFGAAFIRQVFAEYLFHTDRASRRSWLGSLEARLASVARPRVWSLVTAATGVVVSSVLVGSRSGWAAGALLPVALGGAAGIAAYLVSKRTASWALGPGAGGGASDTASIGVGRGAWRIHLSASTVVVERGLVVFMLFEILDGVYSLSVLLWASLLVPIPGVVVGCFGTVVIGSALMGSLPWRAWWRRVVRRPRAV
ncbi:DUF475 domain-containing protein [Curtobacterium sp. MCBD17_026]|nr:DUF475 domain-containing protein [Curtobacterium sp. MCBD17_026]WIB72427.1 DUF475 domain-containing protein [Curtobacterium sp. MCBD17_026]